MQDSVLGAWRDIAIVLLVIEIFVLMLVPGVVFFFAVRGVRGVKRWAKPRLLTACVWALRIQHETMHASRAAVALPVMIQAADARLRATAWGVAEYLGIDF